MLKMRVMHSLDNAVTLRLLCTYQSSSVHKFMEFWGQYWEKGKTTFLLAFFYFPIIMQKQTQRSNDCPKSGAKSQCRRVFLAPMTCSKVTISSRSYRKLLCCMARNGGDWFLSLHTYIGSYLKPDLDPSSHLLASFSFCPLVFLNHRTQF